MGAMVKLAYGHDIVKRVVQVMTEFDPEWKLPEGFFPAKPVETEVTAEPNGVSNVKLSETSNGMVDGRTLPTENGKVDVGVKIQLQEISDRIEAL
jgi:salicylate hydroxylase